MRVIPIITMCLLVAFAAWAEDGELFVRDISKTPDFETDHATIQKLSINVPAHNSQGDVIPVTYIDQEGGRAGMQPDADELVKSRERGGQGYQIELFVKLPYGGKWHVFPVESGAA